MRRATGVPTFDKGLAVISIHALHEESDEPICRKVFVVGISIHALHEESDQVIRHHGSDGHAISIHALHEESDLRCGLDETAEVLFQSTLSMRRATNLADGRSPHSIFQSTLSMRRATSFRRSDYPRNVISIHALHEESDLGAT